MLRDAGVLRRWNYKASSKGKGFRQPLRPHQHWHVDIAYVNVGATFYYLCSVLDGMSRYICHWELRERMTEGDVETIVQRAREKFPGERPRVITDNGPQFIAKDFKAFIRICGMTHVRTSPYYPQSNGKIERFHRSIKSECIRPGTPLSREDAQRLIAGYVTHYNEVRLHSAIGYVTPEDKLERRDKQIHKERDRKLDEARRSRAQKRRGEHALREDEVDKHATLTMSRAEDRALVGTNSSADPEAKIGEGVATAAPLPSPSISEVGTKAKNPRGSGGLVPQADKAAFSPHHSINAGDVAYAKP